MDKKTAQGIIKHIDGYLDEFERNVKDMLSDLTTQLNKENKRTIDQLNKNLKKFHVRLDKLERELFFHKH